MQPLDTPTPAPTTSVSDCSERCDPPKYWRWLLLGILLAGVLTYHNSFAGVFIFDDLSSIVQNPRIQSLWTTPTHLLTHRPVVELSFALNYALGELNPWGYHVVNLAIHLLAGMALCGIVRRTLNTSRLVERFGQTSHWYAWVVSVLWMVHPLQTQSVTYIVQRGESAMGLFYLLTVYCVLCGSSSSRPRWWYITAVAACALGMGSMAVMVTAPIMVLLFDRMFLSQSLQELFRKRGFLYGGLAATWLILLATGQAQAVLDPGLSRSTAGLGYKGISPLAYAMNQPAVILHYIRLSFWPRPLCLDYAWPSANGVSEIILPAMVVIGLLLGTAWCLIRHPALGFLGVWFFVILSPTSSILPVKDLAVEHRMYLPLAALITLANVVGGRLLSRAYAAIGLLSTTVMWSNATVVSAASVLLACGSIERNRDYHSAYAMWSDVAAKRPNNPRAQTMVGKAMADLDRDEEAMAHYQRALELDPTRYVAYNNIGNLYVKKGNDSLAIPYYRKSLRHNSRYDTARTNLGYALIRAGRWQDGIDELKIVLDHGYSSSPVHYHLARSLTQIGKSEEAEFHYHRAMDIEPGNLKWPAHLAEHLANHGKIPQAIEYQRQVIRLNPGHAAGYNNLAISLLKQGQFDEAITHFVNAIRLDPQYETAITNFGKALARQYDVDGLLDGHDPATLNISHARSLVFAGNYFLREGKTKQAESAFRWALRIQSDYGPARRGLDTVLP